MGFPYTYFKGKVHTIYLHGPFGLVQGRRFGQHMSRSHMLTLSGLFVFGNWTGMV